MDQYTKLSERVRVSKTGRVTLSDEKLDALISSSEITTSGGDGSVNSGCTNTGDCRQTMNTTNCTNTMACEGSLNSAGQCRDVHVDS